MGKNSLIKSTTKTKPAAIKEDDAKQAQKVSATPGKQTKTKSDTKPGEKTVKAKKPEKKVPEIKAKTTPQASPAHIPPPEKKPADPAEKMLLYGLTGFVVLVLLVIIASWMNTNRYYVTPSEGAVDVWKGKFAPKGAKHLMNFPGLRLKEPIKDVYSANEVFPIICQYYLDRADMLLNVPGMPDFEGIKDYLSKSQAYAITPGMKADVRNRLDAINLMVLLYKADVAAGKSGLKDLETALGHLKEALTFPMDELETAQVKQKAAAVRERLENMKAAAAETTGGEADKAPNP